jgi:hypothetical protein
MATRFLLLLGLLCCVGPAHAQYTNACQTQFGVCSVPPGPVGSQCVCQAPGRYPDPGMRVLGMQQSVATHCATPQGVCFIGQAPLGVPGQCGYIQGSTVP